jgi:hypothetical protein
MEHRVKMNFGEIMKIFKEEHGSITVVALLILVVLTVLGVTITRTTTLDLKVSTNETMRKQSFYVAEGGVYREAAEVGEGSYVVTNIYHPRPLANEGGLTNSSGTVIDTNLPGVTHQVYGSNYNFDLAYVGFFLPPKGYSVDQFSRYDFDIRADRNNVNVYGRFYRIGPKAK